MHNDRLKKFFIELIPIKALFIRFNKQAAFKF